MENRKGSGIFLGVVSVATLVVAIIGATFAFFTAQIQGNEDFTTESYEFAASMSIEKLANEAVSGTGLIPLNSDDLTKALAHNPQCVDENGYQVCDIYKVTINNTGAQEITLTGTVKSLENGFTENMLMLNDLGEANGSSLETNDIALPAKGATVSLKNQVKVNGASEKVIYYAVYLKNDTSNNQPDDMKKNFHGELTFVDVAGGAQLSGTFS